MQRVGLDDPGYTSQICDLSLSTVHHYCIFILMQPEATTLAGEAPRGVTNRSYRLFLQVVAGVVRLSRLQDLYPASKQTQATSAPLPPVRLAQLP